MTQSKPSREAHERDAKNIYDDNFARGAGDPEHFQNPAEPVHIRIVKRPLIQDVRPAKVIIKELLNEKAPF